MKLIAILFIGFCLSGCLSKSEINFSLLNGLWVRNDKTNQHHQYFEKIYAHNGNILVEGFSGLKRPRSSKCTYRIVGNELLLTVNYGHSSDLYRYNILELNAKRLILKPQNGVEKMVFERKIKDHSYHIKSISLAHNGLQANDVQLDNRLVCKSAFNRKTPTEVRMSKIPKWKWNAIDYICNSQELKSIVVHNDLPPMPDQGEFAMIIELENGSLIKILPADQIHYRFIVETVWDIGIYDKVRREHKNGNIKFHQELKTLLDKPIPEDTATLKFIPLK